MAKKSRGNRSAGSTEKRGGYSSSSKPASSLKPPPTGPAPGGPKPSSGSKHSHPLRQRTNSSRFSSLDQEPREI